MNGQDNSQVVRLCRRSFFRASLTQHQLAVAARTLVGRGLARQSGHSPVSISTEPILLFLPKLDPTTQTRTNGSSFFTDPAMARVCGILNFIRKP